MGQIFIKKKDTGEIIKPQQTQKLKNNYMSVPAGFDKRSIAQNFAFLQARINDEKIKQCIANGNIHEACNICGNNTELLLSHIKASSAHDTPHQNGKNRYV